MSKSLIEGSSPAEELLLSYKQPPQTKLPDEEGQPEKKAAPRKRKPRSGSRQTGSHAADLTAGKRNYRINLALPSALGEALKEEAQRQGRSVNNLAENIIKEYLTK